MSTPALAQCGAVQPIADDALQTQDIATVAYALWQQRGCPDGNPDQDWIEAERMLEGQQATPMSR